MTAATEIIRPINSDDVPVMDVAGIDTPYFSALPSHAVVKAASDDAYDHSLALLIAALRRRPRGEGASPGWNKATIDKERLRDAERVDALRHAHFMNRAALWGSNGPANDNVGVTAKRIRPTLNWPTLARLKKEGRVSEISALVRYRDDHFGEPTAHNNDAPRLTHSTLGALGEGYATPALRDIRPTVFELMAAYSRVAVRVSHGRLEKGNGLRFNCRGELYEWSDCYGRWHAPSERSKGHGRAKPLDRDNDAYLKMRGVPQVVPPHDTVVQPGPPPGFCAPRSRTELRALGVDGSIPYEVALRNAGLAVRPRGSLVIARGAAFLGGVVARAKETVSRQPRKDDALAQRGAPARLDTHTTSILNQAASPATAQSLGVSFGYRGKYAERKGVRMIDEALAELLRVAA